VLVVSATAKRGPAPKSARELTRGVSFRRRCSRVGSSLAAPWAGGAGAARRSQIWPCSRRAFGAAPIVPGFGALERRYGGRRSFGRRVAPRCWRSAPVRRALCRGVGRGCRLAIAGVVGQGRRSAAHGDPRCTPVVAATATRLGDATTQATPPIPTSRQRWHTEETTPARPGPNCRRASSPDPVEAGGRPSGEDPVERCPRAEAARAPRDGQTG
jgi:hypothetical protein